MKGHRPGSTSPCPLKSPEPWPGPSANSDVSRFNASEGDVTRKPVHLAGSLGEERWRAPLPHDEAGLPLSWPFSLRTDGRPVADFRKSQTLNSKDACASGSPTRARATASP